MQLILGSGSPRRREILSYFSIPFTQVASAFDEDSLSFDGNPMKYVCDLSTAKAKALQPKYPDAVILTADTIVYRNGKIYGKPRTIEEAYQSFSELVGQWHEVYTGVTVLHQQEVHSRAEVTKVLFNQLTPEQIKHYLAHVEWADKAGGYAIQMSGGLIINRIEGCYYNVMGLPVNTVEYLLKKVGIELWNYL